MCLILKRLTVQTTFSLSVYCFGMHLDPFFDHKMVFISSYHVFRPLGLVFSAGTTWTLGRSFCSVFCPGGPPGPILFDFYMFCLICCRLGFFSFCHLILAIFPSDVKAAASWTFGSQPCEKLWLSAFNARADNTVISYCKMFCKFKACCLHRNREFSFLPALRSQFPYIFITYLRIQSVAILFTAPFT